MLLVDGGPTTITVTQTSTTTASTQRGGNAVPTSFYIYANLGLNGIQFAENSGQPDIQFDAEDSSDASVYTINNAGNLVNSDGNIAYEPASMNDVLFASAKFVKQQKNALLCGIDASCNLVCRAGSAAVNQVCNAENTFNIQSTQDTADGCTAISPQVADASQ